MRATDDNARQRPANRYCALCGGYHPMRTSYCPNPGVQTRSDGVTYPTMLEIQGVADPATEREQDDG